MALSTDVKLPRSYEPVFPPVCVVCQCPEPESSLRLSSGTIGWWSFLIAWWHRPLTVTAPACHRCAWRLQLGRALSVLITIGISFAALFYLWSPIAQAVPPGIGRLIRLAIVLACLSPLIAYELFWPRAFDVTPFPDSVDYEFASPEMAVEFAIANAAAPWVEIDGERVPFEEDPEMGRGFGDAGADG